MWIDQLRTVNATSGLLWMLVLLTVPVFLDNLVWMKWQQIQCQIVRAQADGASDAGTTETRP